MADLQNPIFTNETKAREALEAVRWPDGPVCPHCGCTERIAKVEGKSGRPGLYYCNNCSGQFTVTVGTVFERSKIPLTKWWLATHLLGSSKKGMSAHHLHRMLGVTYKTAWFMAHRIREAMNEKKRGPLGGDGGVVAVDETYYGNSSKRAKGYKKGHRHKAGIVALVDPATGEARAFNVGTATSDSVRKIVLKNAHRGSALVTDESRLYDKLGAKFAVHQTVLHAHAQYVNSDGFTTNNVENFFGIFKRGMKGIYHFCGEKHLQKYLNEFSFRYTNRHVSDAERVSRAIKGIEGKRLTYRPIGQHART